MRNWVFNSPVSSAECSFGIMSCSTRLIQQLSHFITSPFAGPLLIWDRKHVNHAVFTSLVVRKKSVPRGSFKSDGNDQKQQMLRPKLEHPFTRNQTSWLAFSKSWTNNMRGYGLGMTIFIALTRVSSFVWSGKRKHRSLSLDVCSEWQEEKI